MLENDVIYVFIHDTRCHHEDSDWGKEVALLRIIKGPFSSVEFAHDWLTHNLFKRCTNGPFQKTSPCESQDSFQYFFSPDHCWGGGCNFRYARLVATSEFGPLDHIFDLTDLPEWDLVGDSIFGDDDDDYDDQCECGTCTECNSRIDDMYLRDKRSGNRWPYDPSQ